VRLEHALGLGQPIELVVLETLQARAAEGVGRRALDVVLQPQDVAHLVVAVDEVLKDDVRLAHGVQVRKHPGLVVVAVDCLHAVALLHRRALLELVVLEFLEIVVALVLILVIHALDPGGGGALSSKMLAGQADRTAVLFPVLWTFSQNLAPYCLRVTGSRIWNQLDCIF
jgi:hypothetical protein